MNETTPASTQKITHGRSPYRELYAPYGEPFGGTGTNPTDYGYTGEWADQNNLVYLRARYYDPAIGNFIGQDPLELDNRYSYASSNPIMQIDPSGFAPVFCSNPEFKDGCDQLEAALQRADNAGQGAIRSQLYNTTATYYGTNVNRSLTSDLLKDNIQYVFGVDIGLGSYAQGEGTTNYLASCAESSFGNDKARYGNSVNSLAKLAAALTHIASRLSEAALGNGASLYKSKLGQNLKISLLADGVCNGVDKNGVCISSLSAYEGLAIRAGDTIYFGSKIPMTTIIHELGHNFDYQFAEKPSLPLLNLHLANAHDTEVGNNRPYYSDATPNANGNPVLSSMGLGGRENPSPNQIEVWADMFMTWVLDGYGLNATYSTESGQTIGWQTSGRSDVVRHATFMKDYTSVAVFRLMRGIDMPDDESKYLAFVKEVACQAFHNCGYEVPMP